MDSIHHTGSYKLFTSHITRWQYVLLTGKYVILIVLFEISDDLINNRIIARQLYSIRLSDGKINEFIWVDNKITH